MIINTSVAVGSIYFIIVSLSSWEFLFGDESEGGMTSVRTNGTQARSVISSLNQSKIGVMSMDFRDSTLTIDYHDSDFVSVSSEADDGKGAFHSVRSQSAHFKEYERSTYVPIDLAYCEKGLLVPAMEDDDEEEKL